MAPLLNTLHSRLGNMEGINPALTYVTCLQCSIPLGKRLQCYHHQYTPAPPIQHFTFNLMPTQRYLRVIKDMLPPKYSQILGNISFPRDDGKAIAQDILQGTILAGSDGAVKDSQATCGYVIMPKTKVKWIRCH